MWFCLRPASELVLWGLRQLSDLFWQGLRHSRPPPSVIMKPDTVALLHAWFAQTSRLAWAYMIPADGRSLKSVGIMYAQARWDVCANQESHSTTSHNRYDQPESDFFLTCDHTHPSRTDRIVRSVFHIRLKTATSETKKILLSIFYQRNVLAKSPTSGSTQKT